MNTTDTNQSNEIEQPVNYTGSEINIAGFWRRLGAFILDSMLIGIVGLALGLVFSDCFAQLGTWGLIVGFTVALLYFGILNSHIGNGQTLGKRLTKVRVIDANGGSLSIGKASLRYTVLAIPLFLNGAPIDTAFFMPWGDLILSIVVFGLGLSIIYLFIFNRKTRQSFHDLIVGSWVIGSREQGVKPKGTIWKGHYIAIFIFVIGSAMVPYLMTIFIDMEPYQTVLSLHRTIEKEPNVQRAIVQVGKRVGLYGDAEGRKGKYLYSQVVLANKVDEYDGFANRVAEIIFDKFPDADKMSVIVVEIAYGYDIGIASSWQQERFNFSPMEWLSRVHESQ
ncbi:MAG: RDD family protein [Deltaproteobacteria bacterium]|nr:RDD family protein [Deltaproteobacteria bacterium]